MDPAAFKERPLLISLARSDNGAGLSEKRNRPLQTNLIPLKIVVQASAKRARNSQLCRTIPERTSTYDESARCYIQIWELDQWEVSKKPVKDPDPDAKSTRNDFLAEIGGFIKEVSKNKFRFVTDGKSTTVPAAPADRRMGKLIFKIDQLDEEGAIAGEPLALAVPIQGEVEETLEIGVAYEPAPGKRAYSDNYRRPVYHINNISKIIEDQLQEGGLRVTCWVNLNRRIDVSTRNEYLKIRKKLLKAHTREKLYLPPKGETAPSLTMIDWLTKLKADKIYKDAIPAANKTSDRLLYDIQNDLNFDWASKPFSGAFKTLMVSAEKEIGVGRFRIMGWRPIPENVSRLLDAVHEQHMDSKGDKPKVARLAIYCHGEPQWLGTAGRDPESDDPKAGKIGECLKNAAVGDFVSSFVLGDGRKLLTNHILIALYACSAGRSGYTQMKKKKVDETYGQFPEPPHVLGEDSFAAALHAMLLAKDFPFATVTAHTTVGTADQNPHVRIFAVDGKKPLYIDLVNLVYGPEYRAKNTKKYMERYKGKKHPLHRNAMFTKPDELLPGFVGPVNPKDAMVEIQEQFL